jgi:chemotaxis protein CheZ
MANIAVKADGAAEQRFARRIAELRAERGDAVALADIAEVVESLMTSMAGDISAIDLRIQHELRELVQYIQKAKEEIAAIQPAEIRQHDIPAATDELDAVVKATETATQAILDAAEELGSIAEQAGGETSERILGIVTKIFEASNFQDITGQRITKVVRTLRHIESKIVALARAFGQDVGDAAAPRQDKREGDAALLNGPQLPEAANSQADIDALLASFD